MIDPYAAKIVRRIFQMSIAGLGSLQIAVALEAEKIEMPSYYMANRDWADGKTKRGSCLLAHRRATQKDTSETLCPTLRRDCKSTLPICTEKSDVECFKVCFRGRETPTVWEWKQEFSALSKKRDGLYEQYNMLRDEAKAADRIRYNVENALRLLYFIVQCATIGVIKLT